jgi:hypothetical protein
MVQRHEEEDYPDEQDEKQINMDYKVWKKNTPFLYGWLSVKQQRRQFLRLTVYIPCRSGGESRVGVAQFDCAMAAGAFHNLLTSDRLHALTITS